MSDAALALVCNRGSVIAVQRPEPPYEMALPGGIVERGESPIMAALRELREETGVIATNARYLGAAPSPTDRRRVHVVLVTNWRGNPYAAEGYPARWMQWRTLRAQAVRYGRFLDRISYTLKAAA